MKNFLSSTKGKIIAGAVTLALIAGVVVLIILLNTGYRNIRIADLTGTSRVTSLLSVSDAFKGQNLVSGDNVEVLEKSTLTLALDSDKHVIASELTKFSIEAFGAEGKDSRTVIHLEKGTISNEIDNKLLSPESYVVESPNASMSVRGTIFTVNVFFDNAGLCHTVVEVEQGVVEFAEKGTGNDEIKTLNAGDKAEVISRVENIDNSSVNSENSSSGGNNSPDDSNLSVTGEILTFGDYWYRYNSALGGIEITKYIGKDEVVNIPAEIDGEKVVCIGDSSFEFIKATSVTIPNGVTSIAEYAFAFCSELKSVSIPESVTEIEESAFKQCVKLENVEIPDDVTKIGKEAFSWCIKLTSVNIPNSVTEIEESTFKQCMNLENVEIPDSVTKIGKEAFERCNKLASVNIPKSVTEIGERAFAECTGLTSITIPNSVIKIGQEAFGNCSRLTQITLPDSITTISTGAFSKCVNLNSITIPNSVTEIGNNAFYYCYHLTSITLPDSVTTIGELSFYNCTQLKSLEIPDSVTKIEKDAFYCCHTKITYKGKTYTELNYDELYT